MGWEKPENVLERMEIHQESPALPLQNHRMAASKQRTSRKCQVQLKVSTWRLPNLAGSKFTEVGQFPC